MAAATLRARGRCATRGLGMRVLIVDDDPADLETLRNAVAGRLGHACLVARDGEEAW